MLQGLVTGKYYWSALGILPGTILHAHTIVITMPSTWHLGLQNAWPKNEPSRGLKKIQKKNFLVQLRKTNPFGMSEWNKVIETAINKSTTSPGRLSGFSTKKGLFDVELERFMKALISLHRFTGCVTVSTFVGLGRQNQRQLFLAGKKCKICENVWKVEQRVAFCSLYGFDNLKDVNLFRYKLICENKGHCLRFKLLLCWSSVRQH